MSVFLFGCPAEETDPPIVYNNDYGEGLYILSDQGITYYDYNSPDSNKIIIDDIFTIVNGESLLDVRSIEINGKDLYIVTKNSLYRADIETMQKELQIDGFTDAKNCKYAKFERVYVSDAADSDIKVVDFATQSIVANVETGDSTQPGFIAVNWRRAFVLNSGGGTKDNYDSTLVSIDIKDGVVALNEFSGNVIVDKNPVCALVSGNLIVLCKGIYDENDPSENTESSINIIGTGSLSVQLQSVLNNVYNADNLIMTESENKFFITSNSGVHQINSTSYNASLIISSKIPTVLGVNREKYWDPIDSLNLQVDYLYMDDKNTPNYIYKYSLFLDAFTDSFPINVTPLDMKFY